MLFGISIIAVVILLGLLVTRLLNKPKSKETANMPQEPVNPVPAEPILEVPVIETYATPEPVPMPEQVKKEAKQSKPKKEAHKKPKTTAQTSQKANTSKKQKSK